MPARHLPAANATTEPNAVSSWADQLPRNLTEGLKPIIQWAQTHDLIEDLWLVMATGRLDRTPAAAVTLLDFLSSPSAYGLISQWTDESPAASSLAKIGFAVRRAPEVLQSSASLIGTNASATKLFPNELKHCYLAAALAVAATREPSDSWRTILPTWLLVHAAERALAGNVADNFLRLAARALYNFRQVDGNLRWILEAIAGTPFDTSFSAINLALESNSVQILHRESRRLSPSERSAVKAFISICRFDHAPDETPAGSLFAPRLRALEAHAPFTFVEDCIHSLDPDEPGAEGLRQSDPTQLPQGATDDEITCEATVPPNATIAQQKRVGSSILLLNAEQRQMLPWYWLKPNAHELSRLEPWISTNLESRDPLRSMLAGLVKTGLDLGRSLAQVLSIGVTEDVGADWTISPTTAELRRIPPARNSGWLPKTAAELSWVHPAATWLSLPAPRALARLIANTKSVSPIGPRTLGDYWRQITDEPFEVAFRRMLDPELSRLGSGMIAAVLPQRLFDDSGDEAFARLMASASNSGLPAACAYGSWPSTGLPSPFRAAGHGPDGEVIALGSRLDPIDSLVAQSIEYATSKVNLARGSGSPLDFHNAFVGYLVVHLLAVTGSRPISDPFESVAFFDLEQHFVYIDDKASGEVRQGRLVPIPAELAHMIGKEYPRHLSMLAQVLGDAHPLLSAEVRKLAAGRSDSCLPFFFFLGSEGGTPYWSSVGEKSIDDLGLFGWPLPLNLFRHRLAQRLRRRGLSPEIIDGLLGHAEAHAETYGDYSIRCWGTDMASARTHLDEVAKPLGFRSLASWDAVPPTLPAASTPPSLEQRRFGYQARDSARRKVKAAAYRAAEATIRAIVGEKPLDTLTPDQLYDLSKLLLLNNKGLPTASGHHKYEYLLLKLRHIERKGRRIKGLRRRFFRMHAAPSRFLPLAVGAAAAVLAIREYAVKARLIDPASKIAKAASGLSAALALCLSHRIANERLLHDVLTGSNIRLIRVADRCYLEHGDFSSGANDAYVPVARIGLSQDVAELLGAATSKRRRTARLESRIPRAFEELAEFLGLPRPTTRGGLISAIAKRVDQINLMDLPALKASQLAGRIATTSETWSDLALIESGRRIVIAPEDSRSSESGLQALLMDQTALRATKGEGSDNATHDRHKATVSLFSSIRSLLNGIDPDATDRCGDQRKLPRREISRATKRRLRESRGQVSSAVFLLVEWVIYLLDTPLEASSILRYFEALHGAFSDIAFDADLLEMDSDELTELYIQIMETRSVKRVDYIGRRLYEFHAWAEASEHGLPTPFWEDVPGLHAQRSVCPGLIAESEYLDALQLIWSSNLMDESRKLLACWLLIGGYRFGLRRKEAWGLTREDWIATTFGVLVLVRANRYRSLKRQWSRRQVPQLFPFSSLEDDVIKRCMSRFESAHGDSTRAAIHLDIEGRLGDLDDAAAICALVLKQVTGHPKMSLHHLRHSYANRVFIALSGGLQRTIASLGWQSDDRASIAKCLLGHAGGQRRMAWALARLLGHMGPTTTFASYIHLTGRWLDGCEAEVRHLAQLKDCFDLDSFEPHFRPSTLLLNEVDAPASPLTFQSALRLLRMLARGRTASDAAQMLGLDPQQAEDLEAAAQAIGARMELSATRTDDRSGPAPLDFLQRIGVAGWSRLMRISPAVEALSALPTDSLSLLVCIVGRTRQLVLTDEVHFKFARVLMDALATSEDRVACVVTNSCPEILLSLARGARFAPISVSAENQRRTAAAHQSKRITKIARRRKAKGKSAPRPGQRLQIDAAPCMPLNIRSVHRCALVVSEDGTSAIRNSIELTAALLSLVVLAPPRHR